MREERIEPVTWKTKVFSDYTFMLEENNKIEVIRQVFYDQEQKGFPFYEIKQEIDPNNHECSALILCFYKIEIK